MSGIESFTYKHPMGPKPEVMYYRIDRVKARVYLLGGKDSRGKTNWPSAPAWGAIAKQYNPIASALAKELKKLVKVKMGDDSEAETLAKFDEHGKEVSLWPAGIKAHGPTVSFK